MQEIPLLNSSVLPGLSVGNDSRGTSYTDSHFIVELGRLVMTKKLMSYSPSNKELSFSHYQPGLGT